VRYEDGSLIWQKSGEGAYQSPPLLSTTLGARPIAVRSPGSEDMNSLLASALS
ncbi:unnamed protein product, partial [Effrenium voratum]